MGLALCLPRSLQATLHASVRGTIVLYYPRAGAALSRSSAGPSVGGTGDMGSWQLEQ